MCGKELPASAYAHRYGAVAIMSPSPSHSPSASATSSPDSSPMMGPDQVTSLAGSVNLFNESDPDCSVATHVSFSPTGVVPMCPLLLSIGSSGYFGSISMTLDPSTETQSVRLEKPLYLHVGDDQDGKKGIIGHKITMQYRGGSGNQAITLAEGIVGYNFLPKTGASM